MTTTNPYQGQIIEFHILQSLPVSCLNRDDVGSPKSSIVGGVTRACVSSQCWKRQVRLAMRDLGVDLDICTKRVTKLVIEACYEKLKTDNQECTAELSENIKTLAEHVSKILDDKSSANKKIKEYKASTLIFLSNSDAGRIAEAMSHFNYSLTLLYEKITDISNALKQAKKNKDKELARTLRHCKKKKMALINLKNINSLLNDFNSFHDRLDIALFGRMVANVASMNVEASASFSHAISTHKASSEVDFFTALDDKQENGVTGSEHMDGLEFNSAIYYRYISLNLGQLYTTLAGENLVNAVETFTKALFVAVPSARQATQSAASPWEYAKVYVRKGQRLQVPFETAIKAKNEGFIQPSIDELNKYLTKKEKLSGSLFGKKATYTFGEDENFSIDDLCDALKSHVEG